LTRNNLVDYLTLDIGWCGGITQALKFAALARENNVAIAPHDCTGPVGLLVGAHLSTADLNAAIQETVRASFRTWYPHLVSGLPEINGSHLQVNDTPGHGLSLTSEFKSSAGMRSYSLV
jgi:L-alanine-DL-glutamate epimerase-like enolase superfamily enzyme